MLLRFRVAVPQTIPPPSASGYTRTTDHPLYWALYGAADAPPMVVLHGGPGAHHDYLLPQMLRLGEAGPLLFYDQRGGGRSRTESRDPVTWRSHVADLAAVAREFDVTPLTLVGYSWGGLLALFYAVEAAREELPTPHRLVLIDPAPVSRAFRDEYDAEYARRQSAGEIHAMREQLASSGLRSEDPDAYRQRAFELSVAGFFADPRMANDLTPFRVIGRVQQSVWESLGDYDLVDTLPGVTAPTLVVHGRQDPIPLASSETAARALPDARLVVLENCGHVPYVEQPDALFAAIERFLAETADILLLRHRYDR
ncbi:MAG TPA: alpha/beta fold hydrolase [Gemmatimonadaceae bacterium]|nr:alpha/beta fold hydrolase [Gemmatimonadaceae bacterium]